MQDDAVDLRVQDSHCLYEGDCSGLNPVPSDASIFCNLWLFRGWGMRHDGVYMILYDGQLENNGDSASIYG